MSSKQLKTTVFIPTYNGEHYLKQILDAVFVQKTNFDYDVLIIDSGSTDSTLSIIENALTEHKNFTLIKIPNTEYGHGKTRNRAAQLATGDIVVYLSHDAIPAHDRWLYEIVRPFIINPEIVGVMGAQLPRAHCIPMLKSEIKGVFAGFGPTFGTTIFYKDDFVQDQGSYDAISFYSDVNSAARKEFLLGSVPYQDVKYAEDQLFGRDIIDGGYYKAYAPRASVIHSNDLTLREYSRRMFDETYGLRRIGIPVNLPSRKVVAKLTVRGIARDTRNIIKDHDYTLKRKIYWIAINPLFHIEKWRGVRRACLADLSDDSDYYKYSLENSKKH